MNCQHCGEAMEGEGWQPPMHAECQARLLLGGLNHVLERCLCHGGTEPPDPVGLSKREAAKLACIVFKRVGPARRPFLRLVPGGKE